MAHGNYMCIMYDAAYIPYIATSKNCDCIYLEASSGAEDRDYTYIWRLNAHSNVLIDIFVYQVAHLQKRPNDNIHHDTKM